jgi:hypothetical protein
VKNFHNLIESHCSIPTKTDKTCLYKYLKGRINRKRINAYSHKKIFALKLLPQICFETKCCPLWDHKNLYTLIFSLFIKEPTTDRRKSTLNHNHIPIENLSNSCVICHLPFLLGRKYRLLINEILILLSSSCLLHYIA